MKWSMDTHKYISEITRKALQIMVAHNITSESEPEEIDAVERELGSSGVYKDYNGAVQTQKVTITGADDPSEYIYNKLLYVEDILLEKSKAQLSFNYDSANNTCYVSFTNFMKYNWYTGLELQGISKPVDILLGRLEGNNISQSPVEGEVQDDFKTIKFESGATIGFIFTNPDTGGLSLIETMSDIVLTKE